MTSSPWLSTSELEQLVETFLQTYPCEAVSEIAYCPTRERLRDVIGRYLLPDEVDDQIPSLQQETSRTVAITFCDPNSPGLHFPLPIIIYPPALSYRPEELISIIRDHEYIHALDWFSGIPLNTRHKITSPNKNRFSSKTIRAIMEVRAYRHQLQTIPEEWEDHSFCRTIFGEYQFWHCELEESKRTTPSTYERRAITEFLRSVEPRS